MKKIKRKILSLLLTLCMILSLLPAPVYAAVADLAGNSAAQNESILEQLQDFSGESYEEAYDLLNSLGLLDESGNLVTDESVVLDGKSYSLEKIETLLSDPDTDLTKVAEVDGVPIALGDLKTVIAIERELQYLQEKYFTGRTFEGEALENVNSLMAQLQSQGLTLSSPSTGDSVVLNTTGTGTTEGYPFHYVSTQNSFKPEQGQTFSVKFKLAVPEAIKKLGAVDIEVSLASGSDPSSVKVLDSETIKADAADSSVVYTLTYTVNAEWNDYRYLYLGVSYKSGSISSISFDNLLNFADRSFGTLYGGISFYEPEGFFFGDGSGNKIENYNLFFDYQFELPELPATWTKAEEQQSGPINSNGATFQLATDGDYNNLDKVYAFLQTCKDNQEIDARQRFQVTATIGQNNGDSTALMSSANLFNEANTNSIDGNQFYNFSVDIPTATGFPLTLNNGETATISFRAYNDIPRETTVEYLPTSFLIPFGINTDVTTAGDNGENLQYVTGITTTTSNVTVELVDHEVNSKPTLTFTAPAGTYQSGDLVPITIQGNEYIETSPDATITINNTKYNLSDLHASTNGKFLSLLYQVKDVDGATLLISGVSGITDFFGNAANEVNATVADVTLKSALMKNAVQSFTANYADGKISFSITAKQDEAYKTAYGEYVDTPDQLMQLLVSVDGGEAKPHTVTMGEDSENTDNFAFTAEPYAIAPADAEQVVTVQLQIKDGDSWLTVNRLTATVTVPPRQDVTGVTISVVDPPVDYDYTITIGDQDVPKLQATVSPAGASTTGAWHSTNEEIATIDENGQIHLTGTKVGKVSFFYKADNGTPDSEIDDVESAPLEFTVNAGENATLTIPQYAQDSLIQSGSSATIKWDTNLFLLFPDRDVDFTVKLYKGTVSTDDGNLVESYAVENPASNEEKITTFEIPADKLTAEYPQSEYTVVVSVEDPASLSAQTTITVLAPPAQLKITADKTSITDNETLSISCSITGGSDDASGTLSVLRMADGASDAVEADNCLDTTSTISNGTVTFTPVKVGENGLCDTYTITFKENRQSGDPSSDSIVVRVYKSGALEIQQDGQNVETITLDNTSKVDGSNNTTLPTDSKDIMALRQELGLIEYVGINADAYNWSSFRDGVKWISDNPEKVGIYYQQGGIWNNIQDLSYETYLPQTKMALSSTVESQATITVTHDATKMSDSVTVNVNTLRDKFYLFQVSPAEKTTLTYFNGDGEEKTATTNDEGVLALYEPSGINSDVQFRSGTEKEPNLGTILQENLSSGERDAAKLQLYPLNTITLRPAAKAELYLMKPDGTPYEGTVTLRGGVYLAGYYCERADMGANSIELRPGDLDNTYTTNEDGKLTVYMNAMQFSADGYTGPLTNAELDYWFELSDLEDNKYYPTLVHIQGSMSPDYTLRTGNAVVNLREVPDGQEEQPFMIAQTLSYAKEKGGDMQVRNVLGSTGNVGPNSTFKYTELTSRIMLWGVEAEVGDTTVTMTGENGFAPEGQTVEKNTFPFASIPIVTNTMVLTKETMTDSGWLKKETSENLKAAVYQNDALVKNVTMPFQVIDLTDVKLVDQDAEALVVDMTGRFMDSIKEDSEFSFDKNKVSNAFSGQITGMLNDIQETASPLFRVLITPTEDNTIFNVLVWGGYDSLDIDEFDYSEGGFAMDSSLMEAELDVGVPPLNDLSEMAKGTYDPVGSVNEAKFMGSNSGLDIGAQLTGYYEGQFYFDTSLGEWVFRTIGGGMSAGGSLSFQANVNAWAGPVPITATFAAGIALQLEFKASTVYTDQTSDTSGWTTDALKADSVNDYLTKLRIQGYIDAFGGLGFDYSVLALKIGLFGRLTGDTTNSFLSRTYLKNNSLVAGHSVGVKGEVGIKFFAKFLFVSYETIIGSGSFSYTSPDKNYTYVDDYWNGKSGTGTTSLKGAPTLLSRSYLADYANGKRSWADPSFDSTAAVVQNDANPGSEPVVNDDGSMSAYISDMGKEDYFESRIKVGEVGKEGNVISNEGFGDMSPSMSGSDGKNSYDQPNVTVAAWVRLSDKLNKNAGETISPAEQQQLLNSTEIMAAVYKDNSLTSVEKLTKNASPDLSPATAASGTNAIVFWRSVVSSSLEGLASQETRDTIQFSQLQASSVWSEPTEIYNGSLGSVAGMKAAMLSDGTAIVVFVLDTGSDDEKDPMKGYEIAYRTVNSNGNLGDLVVLTNDTMMDTNPQVLAVTELNKEVFILGWYSAQDGGDIRLQTIGSEGQLYSGSSEYAIPTSVKAITGEDTLTINSNFQFAKQDFRTSLDGVTLLWAETVNKTNSDGISEADHSVLYGTKLCDIDNEMHLSTPQPLITLPDRTLANSFNAWRGTTGQTTNTISAYIFGTWYDPNQSDSVEVVDETGKETICEIPKDTDQLLTGSGTFQESSIEVESIAVDYANLKTNSYIPVTFTLCNTGTTKLNNVRVNMYNMTDPIALLPGESAAITVMYKTDRTIINPTYEILGPVNNPVTGTLYLDYNDVGISSMQVLDESEGKRTVQVTLYNDAAAKLEDASDRTVELSFYSDSQYTKPVSVTPVGNPEDVTVSGTTITFTGDALRRIDQGTMILQVTYDLKDYVNNTLEKDEVPASGVYLYAKAVVKKGTAVMAEYATGNNESAVQLTGAYARTGEQFSLDIDQGTNVSGNTTAHITLRNNSLKDAETSALKAVLLDSNGKLLEEKLVEFSGTASITCETETSSDVTFTQKGSRVAVYPVNNQDTLIFDGLPVKISDFTSDSSGVYRYTLSDVTVPGTLVTAYAAVGTVKINGEEFTSGGSKWVDFSSATNTVTVNLGDKTYVLTVNTDYDPGSGGGTTTYYAITVKPSSHGEVKADRTEAAAGSTVTLTVKPDSGYHLNALTVTDADGKNIKLTNKGSGVYTFTMPSGAVTVQATFAIGSSGGFPFIDVPENSWYYDGVVYVYENGLMEGTSATTFSPNIATSRAMIATILWRLEGSPVVSYDMNFSDVEPDRWYTEAVRWANSVGVVIGYGNGKFGTNDSITREQMAAMLYRYAQYKDYDVSMGDNTNLHTYTDFDQLSQWAVPAMQWACGADIITGTGASTLSPRGSATRAQAAVMFMRFHEKYTVQ
jgi:hypothetical protein